MNLQHHFLIAMPGLDEPTFKRSVVYVCEHNEDGAMGLVINKLVEDFTVENVLDKLEITPSPRDPAIRLDRPVFSGGPLADDRGFILHTPRAGFGSSIQISDTTMITTSKDVLETLGTPEQPKDVLVALGYAAWEQGQLEKELLDNAWLTIEANSDILFRTPIAERWREAAKMIGVDVSQLATHAGHA
ncbi:MAG: YqgE/AlgH family protein [Ewingella americana]|jgi:putative transcriptional regulator|uniref:YqgE/AlgH family protein n=1 Tax=Ewingella americana TaxID=41202 RepID=UPI00242AA014|nr:YqgE/AlgH family protein [Ewingella americana]MCI1679446.1 YqgE/AlgH family protein [Ewingella americana]MCI1854773.1 YqgE/AlgH family protein [Ewingella americana]MCI1861944.1 YqgE/AlgH family protein [Ewingella americana]MCI2141581.1 YqgE/AlgH family protein [Ewingella americana]MCI2162151.1 YqgE/AlgH family protein [Ewingella americana]